MENAEKSRDNGYNAFFFIHLGICGRVHDYYVISNVPQTLLIIYQLCYTSILKEYLKFSAKIGILIIAGIQNGYIDFALLLCIFTYPCVEHCKSDEFDNASTK